MARFEQVYTVSRIGTRLSTRSQEFLGEVPWAQLKEEGGPIMALLSHGPLMGWIPLLSVISKRINEQGWGPRSYAGVAHPIVLRLPKMKQIVYGDLPLPKSGRLRFEDYVRLFEHGLEVMSLFPEGENCLYGNGVDIQPFRSPRFVEIALRARCRILLVVGRGYESWQRQVSIASPRRKRWIRRLSYLLPPQQRVHPELLEANDSLSLPWLMPRIPRFQVGSALYEPALTLDELSEDRDEKHAQLTAEAERVRVHMQQLVDRLKAQ